MADVRSPVSGTLSAVPVDEGQLVAEEDEIARVRTDDDETIVVTRVPGVVRELYAEPGRRVETGDVLAMIDES